MNETTDICPSCGVSGCSHDFDAMLAKGRKAWAGVPDANQWVEQQRGAIELRTNATLRQAILRLRLIEVLALENQPDDDAAELTASIDALVAALRQQGVLK